MPASSTVAKDFGSFIFSDSFEFLKSVTEQRELGLSICQNIQQLITEQVVPSCKQILENHPSQQWQSRTTVGLTLKGTTIAGITIGGPAFLSSRLSIGDVIVMVDRKNVTSDNLQDLLVGSDEPGSTVTVTVMKSSASTEIRSPAVSDSTFRTKISVELDRVRVDDISDHRYLQTKLEYLLVVF
jgi:hypothetical protein